MLGEMRKDKLIRRLDGIGCNPAVVIGTREDFMNGWDRLALSVCCPFRRTMGQSSGRSTPSATFWRSKKSRKSAAGQFLASRPSGNDPERLCDLRAPFTSAVNHTLKFGINTRRLDVSNYDLGEGTVPTVVYNDLAQFTYGAAYTASRTFLVSLKERVAVGNLEYYAMDTYKPDTEGDRYLRHAGDVEHERKAASRVCLRVPPDLSSICRTMRASR